MKTSMIATTALIASLCSAGLQAQDSGFLTSYDNLEADPVFGLARSYVAPGAVDKVANFNRVMIDQPEIIIAADSKYRGAKPSDMMEISEALRQAMIEGIGGQFPVVDSPGEGAALISWAVTNVYVKKAKRGLLSYTPVGAVAYGAKSLATDVVDKTRSYDVVLEFEATDTVTGEVLFAMVVDLGQGGDEVEFESGLAVAYGVGARIGCRLANSRLAVDDRQDCLQISLASQD